MIKLSKMNKVSLKGKKRVGRGRGSGKGGHTAGRGQKGQKSRTSIGLTFEGTKIKKSLLKRLPLLRGKGKLKATKGALIVNLKYLNLLAKDTIVDIDSLVKAGIIKNGQELAVKILGDGELDKDKNLTIKLPVSKQAKLKIEKAGSKVFNQSEEKKVMSSKK
ncbi:MAG: 50S ribosomal protein L15 [Candidatus Curtissbacteria bacterium]|nr:50S ribosomal protein L15 [bacterium]MDZ4209842.1 50S ribosomal protein L15 [Candidatus Curtissbacteria bacterium]